MSSILLKRRWPLLSVIFAIALLGLPGTGYAQDEPPVDDQTVTASADEPAGEEAA